MSAPQSPHVPVLLEEVIAALAPMPGAVIVDATAERVVLRDSNGQYEVPMADIRRAKLLLTDELIAASAPQAAKAH